MLKYAPKTKIGFNNYKTKTKWCIAESSLNVVFFFQTEANSTYHTKKSKTAVTATGATKGS